MFKFYINILLLFCSFLISTSGMSQTLNGLKDVVSSQQGKIATIEETLKKLIGSIEDQSKKSNQSKNNKLYKSEIDLIIDSIRNLESKINNISTFSYDLEFSIKRIERHLELSSINNKRVKSDELKEKPKYQKNDKIEIDKKSLDSKTNGVLGFIKETSKEEKKNKSLTQDNKIVKNDFNVLPKGSIEDRYKFAEDIALSGDYSKAEKALKEFLSTHKGHKRSADAQFMLGRVYYNQDKYEEATFELAQFNGNYPSDPRFQKSTLLIAEAVVNFANKKQACDILKQSLDFMQNPTDKFKIRLNYLINEKQCSSE